MGWGGVKFLSWPWRNELTTAFPPALPQHTQQGGGSHGISFCPTRCDAILTHMGCNWPCVALRFFTDFRCPLPGSRRRKVGSPPKGTPWATKEPWEQRTLFTSRSGQGRLAATRGGQERPGAPKGGQGRPGATRDGQSRPGAARGGQARCGQGRPKGGQEAHEAAKALQREPKNNRWAAKRAQWGDHERPRGGQREAKGTQREPKGTQREPRGTQRAAKGRPRQQTHKKS